VGDDIPPLGLRRHSAGPYPSVAMCFCYTAGCARGQMVHLPALRCALPLAGQKQIRREEKKDGAITQWYYLWPCLPALSNLLISDFPYQYLRITVY